MRHARLAICSGVITVAGLFLLPSPSFPSEAMDKAVDLYRQGQGQEARELLAEHLESNPDDLDARIGYCRIRRALGEGEALRKEVAAYVEANRDDPAARLVQLVTLPNSLDKRNSFQEFVEQHPENARGWEEFGRLLVDRWIPAMALDPLTQAAELAPDRAEPHFLLGLAYRALGRSEEEKGELAKARELDPDDAGIAFEWASTILYGGETEKAIPLLESLLLELPVDPFPPALLALAYHRTGDEAKMAEAKKMVLERSPTFFNGLIYRGIQMRGMGQHEEAKKVLNLVIDLDPDHVEAYMQLGVLYRQKKEYPKAIEVYSTAVELEEGAVNQFAWRNLGMSYQEMGNLPTAEEHFRKSLELDSDYLLCWVDFAHVLGMQGKFDEAIQAWNRVLSMAPYGWEAAAARRALPLLEQKEIPPSLENKIKYVSPFEGMKPEDLKKK